MRRLKRNRFFAVLLMVLFLANTVLGITALAGESNLFVGVKSTFESDTLPEGWAKLMCGSAIGMSTAQAHSGTHSIIQQGRESNSWHSPEYNIYDLMKQRGPGIYELSLWVYTDSGNAAASTQTGRLVVRTLTPDYSFVTEKDNKLGAVASASIPNRTWTQLKGLLKVTQQDLHEGFGQNIFYFCIDNIVAPTLYADDAGLRYVAESMPTATPSPVRVTPTPKPTVKPTVKPTAVPTVTATVTATPEPSASPTAVPTVTVSPAETPTPTGSAVTPTVYLPIATAIKVGSSYSIALLPFAFIVVGGVTALAVIGYLLLRKKP